jgi:hypothetical protein
VRLHTTTLHTRPPVQVECPALVRSAVDRAGTHALVRESYLAPRRGCAGPAPPAQAMRPLPALSRAAARTGPPTRRTSRQRGRVAAWAARHGPGPGVDAASAGECLCGAGAGQLIAALAQPVCTCPPRCRRCISPRRPARWPRLRRRCLPRLNQRLHPQVALADDRARPRCPRRSTGRVPSRSRLAQANAPDGRVPLRPPARRCCCRTGPRWSRGMRSGPVHAADGHGLHEARGCSRTWRAAGLRAAGRTRARHSTCARPATVATRPGRTPRAYRLRRAVAAVAPSQRRRPTAMFQRSSRERRHHHARHDNGGGHSPSTNDTSQSTRCAGSTCESSAIA